MNSIARHIIHSGSPAGTVGLTLAGAVFLVSCGGAPLEPPAAPTATTLSSSPTPDLPPPAGQPSIPSDARRIWAESGRVCALRSDRTLWCMGINHRGQLGDGTSQDRDRPTLVTGLHHVQSVALGQHHGCASTVEGNVLCWGSNAHGQLGDGTLGFSHEAQAVPGLTDVTALIAGSHSTIARQRDGSLVCWGFPCLNALPESGPSEVIQKGCGGRLGAHCNLEPRPLPRLRGFEQLVAGPTFVCGHAPSGPYQCFNSDSDATLDGFADVKGARSHRGRACLLSTTDELHCIDASYGPSPANNRRAFHVRASPVASLPGANHFTWSSHRAYGLKPSGGVLEAFVGDALFQAPDRPGQQIERSGAGSTQLEASLLLPASGAIDIAASDDLACALLGDDRMICAGALSSSYALLPQSENLSWSPVTIPGMEQVTALDSDETMTCAAHQHGAVSCFGRWALHSPRPPGETDAEQGRAPGQASHRIPTPVVGVENAVEIDVARAHACARTQDGSVFCWNHPIHDPTQQDPYFPALGHASRSGSLLPVRVQGLTNAQQVSLSSWHACAVEANGAVQCWGLNDVGQLGPDPDETVQRNDRVARTPVQVGGLPPVVQVAVGRAHSCARTADGEVWCWGGNGNGQLADGTVTPRSTPAPIQGLADVVELEAGGYSLCARTGDGAVYCWGFLGCDCDEGRHHQTRPERVAGLPPAASLRMGPRIQCAQDNSNTIYCWNHHVYAREFAPPNRERTGRRPFRAPVASASSELAPGERHVCVADESGRVHCWGNRDIIGIAPVRGLFEFTL